MRLSGLGVSPGIGIGKALVLKRGARDLRFRIPAAWVDRELERVAQARLRSREQLQHIRERIATSIGAEHAYLFDAQLLMLDDADRSRGGDHSHRTAERGVCARARVRRDLRPLRSS
jgi:phosphoenolpyruvate-protein phosphotransferase (PTS system enzyme I)